MEKSYRNKEYIVPSQHNERYLHEYKLLGAVAADPLESRRPLLVPWRSVGPDLMCAITPRLEDHEICFGSPVLVSVGMLGMVNVCDGV
jgi:hypothetical protein